MNMTLLNIITLTLHTVFQKQGDELDLHLEEAQRRFRHVAIKRLVTKISDYCKK